MNRKIVLVAVLASLATLIFQGISFYKSLSDLSPTNVSEIEAFSDAFNNQVFVGNMLSLLLLLLCNIYGYITKKAQWVFLALAFYAVTEVLNSFKSEAIFHFRKANGLWDGSFSLGLIGAAFLIVVAALAIFINYLLLQYVIKKRRI